MVHANTVPPLVRVWVATLADADLAFRAWLDDRELERYARLQAEVDRARFLLGAAMLRSAVGSELGMSPREVTVDRGCADCGRWHGRPVVPGTLLALSVSHGGLVVVLALTVDGPVGVDVERVDGRQPADVRAWTRAEARFKAGSGHALGVQELAAPVPGHVLTLAAAPTAAVQVLPAASVLARPPPWPGSRTLGNVAGLP
jgi:4'-phosphopantetheinyl transferase